jgi:hypothetical protein
MFYFLNSFALMAGFVYNLRNSVAFLIIIFISLTFMNWLATKVYDSNKLYFTLFSVIPFLIALILYLEGSFNINVIHLLYSIPIIYSIFLIIKNTSFGIKNN